MRKQGAVYIIVILVSLADVSYAQSVGNYTVARTTGITYNSILSTGNSIAGWRNTGSFIEDDNRSIATPIGFDFWYNGQRFTQFSVSTNGFIDFSSSTDNGGPQCDDYGYCNTFFSSSTNGTWLALAPFYDDMTTAGGVDPLGTSIKYQLSGTAPNRVLTVEWIDMAVYQNTTPSLNFQVKLYETSGVIEFLYGTMTNGTNTFSYTVGINAALISNPATTTELLTQQTANTTTFSNSPQNNLSAMPSANSRLRFVPPMPSNPSGNLTFTGVTNTGMTINWTNWASNEIGYAVYYSQDNTNFFYYTQTAANATSTLATGLSPSTTYYWMVYAVTEGTQSAALTGNATTLVPGTVISISDGRWDQAARWDCNCVPSLSDNVIVNHNVRISNANALANDLTINPGPGNNGRVRFTRNTARTLTVNGNLNVNTGSRIVVVTNSNATHTMNIRGNIVNNDQLNFNADANSRVITNFTNNLGNQTLSGTGATTNFYIVNLNMGAKSNTLEVTASNFSCDPDALNFVSGGTFKFSSSGTNTFTLFNSTRNIPLNGKVWMNSSGGIMNFEAGVSVQGELVVDNGNVNIGNAADENLIANGGSIAINGGNLNIAGRLDRNSSESTTIFIQTGGVVTVPTVGSTSTTQAPFGADVTGSSMVVSGGTIVVEREGGTGAQNLGINTSGVTNAMITGGTLQVGNANTPAAQIIGVELGHPVSNLVVNSANATAELQGIDASIQNDVTITAGTFSDNNFELSLSGNWLVASGLYINSALGAVNFIGSNQSITSSGTSFSNINLVGTGVKSILDNLRVAGDLNITSELGLSTAGLQLSIGGDWINDGVFTRNAETLLFNGAAGQSLGGTSLNSVSNIAVNKSGGILGINSQVDFYGTMDIQNASNIDFDGAGSGIFRLISSATSDARIGAVASGASLTGNILFEKYFAGQGFKYWRHIGSAVIDATVADMQNEIPISGTFTGNQNGTNGIPSFAFPSLYRYDPSAGLPTETLDDRWVVYPTATNSETLSTTGNEAQGYAIWVRETNAITFDLTGPVNFGTIDCNISGANEGWNLVGNPYPSDIDWDAAGWTKTDIQGSAIHMWNGNQYLTWNGTSGSLANGHIAKGQGFWVQASSGAPLLVASESVKTTTPATTYRLSNLEVPVLELTLSSSGYTDKTYIQFDENSLMKFDSKDATKLKNAIFNFASLSSDSVALSINVLNGSCGFEVPLVVDNAWNGSYAMNWIGETSVFDIYNVELVDNYTETTTIINPSVPQYNFEIGEDEGSKSTGRFFLRFNTMPIEDELIISSEQQCETNQAVLYIENSQLMVQYDILVGETVTQSKIGNGSELVMVLDSGLNYGTNSLRVHAKMLTCGTETKEYSHEIRLISKPEIIYDSDENTLSSMSGFSGLWYLNDDLISGNPTSVLVPDSNLGGLYKFEVTNSSCTSVSDEFLITDLEENIKPTNLSIWPNPTTDFVNLQFSNKFSENLVELKIFDVTGKLYYINGTPISRIDVSKFESGIYFLTVITDSESVSLRFIKQ